MGKPCIEVNLEYGHPRLEDALDELKNTLKTAKQNKVGCIVFIHGYGSSGKGVIPRPLGRKARKVRFPGWTKKPRGIIPNLFSRQKKGEIKTVIKGEDFTIFEPKAIELKNKYNELVKYIGGQNHGITVVEL